MSIGEHVYTTSATPATLDQDAIDRALDEILLVGALSERSETWLTANSQSVTQHSLSNHPDAARCAAILTVSRSMSRLAA